MNLDNIKTITEFYEFGDIWYQRSHRLREVWQNKLETQERRGKAFVLWLKMYNRVMKLIPFATKISQVK
jgi:outer membrane protein assembly factor BamD (BamD/ComL family)